MGSSSFFSLVKSKFRRSSKKLSKSAEPGLVFPSAWLKDVPRALITAIREAGSVVPPHLLPELVAQANDRKNYEKQALTLVFAHVYLHEIGIREQTIRELEQKVSELSVANIKLASDCSAIQVEKNEELIGAGSLWTQDGGLLKLKITYQQ